MAEIIIKDSQLRLAAGQGAESFLQCILQGIKNVAGGKLDEHALQTLSADQVTLWAYDILRGELMEGGFVQLIYNGWADFFFGNPFAHAMKQWGLRDLSKMMYGAATPYKKYRDDIMKDCSDEDFMALYERFPDFEEFDDEFVDKEEDFTQAMAKYVDDNLSRFCTVIDE